jgi:RNA polymerase sigma factor (sigma-70 family)
MREAINNVLFDKYKEWASNKALEFKYSHKYICSNIKNDDLISCALIGLYKGIKRFNGNDTFIHYVSLYIKWELQKCMAKSIPINALPKTYFKKKKTPEEYKKLFNVYLKPLYIGFDNHLMENTEQNSLHSNENQWLHNEDDLIYLMKIWEKIQGLSEFQIKIMYYKYSVYFDRLRTNVEIAKLLNCSIEKVNKNLLEIKNNLLPLNIDIDT